MLDRLRKLKLPFNITWASVALALSLCTPSIKQERAGPDRIKLPILTSLSSLKKLNKVIVHMPSFEKIVDPLILKNSVF